MLKGSCLCGGVTWQTNAQPRNSVGCHCSQCRKVSGHFWSATQVPTETLVLTKSDTMKWFQSSPQARRSFCETCGSTLFWEKRGEGMTSIASGSIDGPSGLTTTKHICCADKGDYYVIHPDIEQIP